MGAYHCDSTVCLCDTNHHVAQAGYIRHRFKPVKVLPHFFPFYISGIIFKFFSFKKLNSVLSSDSDVLGARDCCLI